MRVQTRRGLLQYSLLPSSQLLYGKLTFNQFEGLYQLSRSSAKKCLASLIDQLRRSLDNCIMRTLHTWMCVLQTFALLDLLLWNWSISIGVNQQTMKSEHVLFTSTGVLCPAGISGFQRCGLFDWLVSVPLLWDATWNRTRGTYWAVFQYVSMVHVYVIVIDCSWGL